MTLLETKKFYSQFLKNHGEKLHFAAHSHHFWPDVTREAQLEYWDDCSKLSDEKWSKIFGEVLPKTQNHIASILNLKDPKQIVIAPNTHELSTRLLSLFIGKSNLSILTTTSEFHSWRRQVLRLKELSQVQIDFLSTENILNQRVQFLDELKNKLKTKPDIFFISQVFFDSGIALTDAELLELQKSCSPETIMVIDGYHAFAAIPTDLSQLEGKVFYLGGGYKYAQAGEGVGFMVVPKGEWRPVNTGWFGDFGDLSKPPGAEVGYAKDAMAFMGATQDPSGMYRFNAVWDLFEKEKLNIKEIHHYVSQLQLEFIKLHSEKFLTSQKLKAIYHPELTWHGHFLTFESSSDADAEATQKSLNDLGVLIDRRGKRLRFGFGLYQNMPDVISLINRLEKMA